MARGLIAVFSILALNAEAAVSFTVSPNPALMDERISVKVAGCQPNRPVLIRARSRDQRDRLWRSAAVFIAGPDGSVDLSGQANISCTYPGVDAMGLFWSMQPDGKEATFFAAVDPFKPIVTEIDAVVDARVVGTTHVERRFAAPGVRAERFNTDGVVGILYTPAGSRRQRAVILLGGSEGGIPEPEGAMLASRGFVTLALAYFGVPGLPGAMQKIPVEYFGKVIHCVLKPGGTVTLFGASRGAEAALIAGSMYPEVDGVIGVSPSHVRWEGATARMLPGGPAWTWEGKPLPYVPFHIGPGFALRYAWNAVTRGATPLNPMFVDSLRRDENEAARIPVERIRGPVLLASGSDDRKWPSSLMSARAIDSLRRNHHPYPYEHVCFEGAGHWLPSSYVPTGGLRGRAAAGIGGTPEATAGAQAQWWPKVLRFLDPATA